MQPTAIASAVKHNSNSTTIDTTLTLNGGQFQSNAVVNSEESADIVDSDGEFPDFDEDDDNTQNEGTACIYVE